VISGDDKAAKYAWKVLSDTLLYSAKRIPEIADDVVNVDRAMRWGFNWAKGPFELLDALGPARVISKLEAEGQPLPRMLEVLRTAGAERFYGGSTCLGADGAYHPVS
jgi:3-hydroxyacyl-CoA dehydrogenase